MYGVVIDVGPQHDARRSENVEDISRSCGSQMDSKSRWDKIISGAREPQLANQCACFERLPVIPEGSQNEHYDFDGKVQGLYSRLPFFHGRFRVDIIVIHLGRFRGYLRNTKLAGRFENSLRPKFRA